MGWLAATQARLIDGDRERLRAEMALRGSEGKYRLVADNADDWIYWVAPDGNLRFISPSWQRVSGYSMAGLTDHPHLMSDIVHPEDKADFLRHSEKLPDRHESDSLEFRIITKTGDVRWISHSCGPIHTREGLYAGRLGTNRDVTARSQAEVRMIEQVDELRRWHAATIGREGRVLELKKEVNDLLTLFGQPPRYPSVWPDGGR